ncbi:MAG: hypothetical protein EOM54_05605 [Clostridia bacterium]|nr:hypothetical protein [Clostridia bacterium]
MTDRIPINILANGAIKQNVYDAEGNLLRTEYVKRDDGATVTGTALSKANLLTDATETAIFGDADDRTVDDALAQLKAGSILPLYEKIRDITDASGTAISVDVSDIDWTVYSEIRIRGKLTSTSSTTVYYRVNNLSTEIYKYLWEYPGAAPLYDTLAPYFTSSDISTYAPAEFDITLSRALFDNHPYYHCLIKINFIKLSNTLRSGLAYPDQYISAITSFNLSASSSFNLTEASLWGIKR